MVSISATNARAELSDILNRVYYQGERISINKSGKITCAIISVEDLKLLEAIEDMIDIKAAKAAMKRKDFVSWDEVKKNFGL